VRGGRGANLAVPTIKTDGGLPDAHGRAAPHGSAGDAFGLDPSFRDRVAPAFRFLHDRYWRVEVSGARNLPEHGPVLLVANHSGAIPFDGCMIVTAVDRHRGRTLRFLYDRFVDNLSPVGAFYRKVGGAVATHENADSLLRMGEMLLLFPEGVAGVAKPFGDRYRLRPFSTGFARIALALDVPVVPVAVVGAEEIYPVVGRAESVGQLLGMPYVPVTPFFPMLGLLGTVPLPTKWFIRFGKPIRLSAVEREGRRQPPAQREAMRVRRTVQAMVRRLKAQRRSIFFG
jgi:1-acyl-sn-glycerol-3-phosphate acyltransferase